MACTPVAGAKTLFKLIRTVAATSKSFKLSCVCTLLQFSICFNLKVTSYLPAIIQNVEIFNSDAARHRPLSQFLWVCIFDISQTVYRMIRLTGVPRRNRRCNFLSRLNGCSMEWKGCPAKSIVIYPTHRMHWLSLDLFWSHKYTCCSHTLMQPWWHFIHRFKI